MRTLAWRLRAAALLSAGVVVVHQLRYLLAYGQESHHALHAQGHAYLALLVPAIVLALTLCAASVVGALVRAERGGRQSEPPRLRRAWGQSAAVLLFLYAAQEGIEGALETGHPGGLAALVGHGGWIALPLAVVVGLLIALLLRGAKAAVARVVAWIGRPTLRRASEQRRPDYRTTAPSLNRFACFLVGRGPPVVCS